jgi:hypothetical protein
VLYVAKGVYTAYKGKGCSDIFSTQSSPTGRVLSQSGNSAGKSVVVMVLAPQAICCWAGAALRLPPF